MQKFTMISGYLESQHGYLTERTADLDMIFILGYLSHTEVLKLPEVSDFMLNRSIDERVYLTVKHCIYHSDSPKSSDIPIEEIIKQYEEDLWFTFNVDITDKWVMEVKGELFDAVSSEIKGQMLLKDLLQDII